MMEKSLKKNKQVKQTLPHYNNDWKSGKLAKQVYTLYHTHDYYDYPQKKWINQAWYRLKANVSVLAVDSEGSFAV